MAEEKKTAAEETVEKKPTATKAAEKKPAAAKKPAAKKPAAAKTAAKKETPAKKATTAKKPAAEKKEVAAKKPAPTGKTVVVAAKKAAPKKADEKLAKGTVKITLKKALTGRKATQIAVAHSLGLKKIGDVVIQPDNAATNGKIAKISFLLAVAKA